MTTPILQGLRVVELARAWSASALCGTLLAELGAEVFTLDASDDAADRLLAAGKRRITIDGTNVDRERTIESLVASADVVLDDREYTRSCGLEPAIDRGASRNPPLVHCIVTAFGNTGPLRDVPGGELIVQAASGAMATTGFPGDPPTRVGIPVGDHTASFYAGCGVLAALHRRLTTNRGETIDLAIRDCLLAYLATFLPAYAQTRQNPGRIGNLHPMVAPWNAYRAADGWVIVCVGSDKQWSALTQLIGGDALKLADAHPTRESRLRHRDEVDALVARWASDQSVEGIVTALDALDIPAGPIQTIADLVADPQFQARTLLDGDPGDAASLRGLGPLFKMKASVGGQVAGRDPRPPSDSHRNGPLAGVRVVECAAYTAGPLCARILADLGAEVVKVEPHDGDPVRSLGSRLDTMSHIFHILNRGKKSVTVDARTSRGRATLLALCAQSDVLVENLAPGVLAKWGLDTATLHATNPSLVYASINGYGWNGPMGAKRAFDTVIQARAAVLSQTGYAGGPPTKMGASLADVACAVFGAFAITAALYDQRRNGNGRFLDVSMFDVLVRMSARSCIAHLQGRGVAHRIGNADRDGAPENLYRAKDAFVVISATTDEQWARVARLLESAEYVLAERWFRADHRLAESAAIDAVIARWAANVDAEDLVARCRSAGVPAARVHDVGDVVDDAQVAHRAMMPRLDIGSHGVPLLGSPLHFRTDAIQRSAGRAPALGAHNDEIIGALQSHALNA